MEHPSSRRCRFLLQRIAPLDVYGAGRVRFLPGKHVRLQLLSVAKGIYKNTYPPHNPESIAGRSDF